MRIRTILFVVLLAAWPAMSEPSASCSASKAAGEGRVLRVGSRTFSFPGDSMTDVTRTSSYCVACHDGLVARMVLHGPRAALASSRTASAEHPVDVQYPRMAAGFRPAFELDPRLRLQDGLVTCDTCHGGDESVPYRLSITIARSDLCLGCHLK